VAWLVAALEFRSNRTADLAAPGPEL